MKVYDVAQVSVAAPHRFHVTQAGRGAVKKDGAVRLWGIVVMP